MKKDGSGSISQMQGSADPDPDPHPNVMDPQHCPRQKANTLLSYYVKLCLRTFRDLMRLFLASSLVFPLPTQPFPSIQALAAIRDTWSADKENYYGRVYTVSEPGAKEGATIIVLFSFGHNSRSRILCCTVDLPKFLFDKQQPKLIL